MRPPKLLGAVQPFIAAAAVILTASILVIAIYYTLLDLEWIAFLAGTLFAAILAMVSRAARAEFAAASIGTKFAQMQQTLSEETGRRKHAEAALKSAGARLRFADELIPVMIAFVDKEGIYRYHNQAYRQWLDLPAHRIDGNHLRRVLGRSAYAQVESEISRALASETVHYERTQRMVNGSICRLSVQLVPVFDKHGKTSGFFVISEDVTARRDLQAQVNEGVAGDSSIDFDSRTEATLPAEQHNPARPPADSVAHNATDLPDIRGRILAAIERNEFTLFCQKIKPLNDASGIAEHFEVLIRLIEEEDNMIPPGAFFPLAEEQGLLPQLDRWVVANILKYLADHGNPGQSVHFINLASATLSDHDFPDYVEQQLTKSGVSGQAICFEIMGGDLLAPGDDARTFIHRVRQAGCRVALCGFGRDSVSVELLKNLPTDFLKIDGGVILQLLKDPAALGKIVAINRVAKVIGIATIAEMVEDEATVACLRQASIDFAQGFGISLPAPLRVHANTFDSSNLENGLEFDAGTYGTSADKPLWCSNTKNRSE